MPGISYSYTVRFIRSLIMISIRENVKLEKVLFSLSDCENDID